jgi:tetratricopeptide (TPR) repeat protein
VIWILGVVTVAVLFFIFINRPARLAASLATAAVHAFGRRDWAAAAKLFGHSYETAGLLKEPMKSRMECQIEMRWAAILYRQGQLSEAEDMLRRGLVTARQHFPSETTELVQASLMWGDICADQERHPEAEEHYRKVLEDEERRGNLAGEVFALQRLGDCFLRQGRRDEAEEAIHRAIGIETQVVREQMAATGQDPASPVISMNQPDLHFCRGEYEDARRLYREKVEFWGRQAVRPAAIELGRLQMRLAEAEARTQHAAEAAEMFAAAEATFQYEWCEGHPKAAAAHTAVMSFQAECESDSRGVAGR